MRILIISGRKYKSPNVNGRICVPADGGNINVLEYNNTENVARNLVEEF